MALGGHRCFTYRRFGMRDASFSVVLESNNLESVYARERFLLGCSRVAAWGTLSHRSIMESRELWTLPNRSRGNFMGPIWGQ